MANKLKVTYTKSTIGGNRRQRDTIRSFGFSKLHQSRVVDDSAMFRGMINVVNHLAKVDEV